MAVVEEDLRCQAIYERAGAPGAGDDGGVGCWHSSGLGRLPGASAAKDVLQLLHAGHSCTKAVELVLQAGVLAPDLLIEGDDRHARPPQGAFITPSLVLVHDGQLPEISKQNHAGQALGRTPHSQDAVKLRCSQHGDLVQNNEVVLG